MIAVDVNPELVASLKRRGLGVHRHSPGDELIFSGLSDEMITRLYLAMKRYSVRLLMRDIVKYQDGFTPDMLGGFTGIEEIKASLMLMVEMGIVKEKGGISKLNRQGKRGPLRSFGPTLEWFTAQVMEREFASPTIWGVRIKDVDSGGDFDIISQFEKELIYIEVKSSPPKGIEEREITSFLGRINILLPRAAILLVDTHLRMRDRVVLLFHQDFLRRMKDPFPRRLDLVNLERELFHIGHRIYIMNSSRDMVKNISVCLRDFLSQGLSVWGI